MTNEKSSGGTAWVNPAEQRKHALDGNTASVAEEEKLEGVLIKEEEHLMEHDEEIPSDEEETDPITAERKMLTVALVTSVVETANGAMSEKRYGLRKRRRPTGEDLRLLEHNQSTRDGGLARAIKREDAAVLPEERPVLASPPLVKEETPPPQRAIPPKPPSVKSSTAATSLGRAVIAEDRKPSPAVRVKVEPLPPGPTAMKRRVIPPPKAESPLTVPVISANSTVPNPLSAIPIQPSTMSLFSSKAAHTEITSNTTVPCPLPATAVVVEDKSYLVMPDTVDKRKVTISEPTTRSRGFSIDLDLGGFDIGGDASTEGDLPLTGGGRNRAFSFECFAFGINADEPLPPLGSHETDSISTGRPRGDSIIFDPSSFQEGGIHEQNALEKARLSESRNEPESSSYVDPPVADVSVSQSEVINDETEELARPNVAVSAGNGVKSSSTVANHVTPPAPVTSYTTTKTTATSTTTTTTMLPAVTAVASTTTFSMELLNKDGRIGIYLPEARKARIARFHEKRARRIWRKRIKYDCRKKLADSRPRIKGRFVKRSDMDDE